MTTRSEPQQGLVYALIAYGLWGVFPIYWKQLSHISASVVLAHRVLWSAVFMLLFLALRGGLKRVWAIAKDPPLRRALLLSTLLISCNWGLFIWSVANDRVTEASLGYYMNPLVNIVLARLVLAEELSRLQRYAVALAALAVVYLTVSLGKFPWVSIVLAVSFSFYGLVRKRTNVSAADGLTVETSLAAPIALAFLVWADPRFVAVTDHGTASAAWLIGAGLATALPLLAFAAAARRLRYTTLGMVQYLAPTLQLLCAVVIYGEVFSSHHAITFALLWTGIALYLVSAIRQSTRVKSADAAS